MPPVARTPAQRGPFGRWLKHAREDRYDTQAQAVAEVRRLAGLSISPSEWAQWESGSRVPREDNPKVARLYEFFGTRPDEETGPAAVGEAGLADALSSLVVELQAMRQERESIEARLRALEAEVQSLRAQPANGAHGARSAPVG